MKQLQWDKLPQQQVGKTLWKEDEPEKEHQMLKKLQLDGVWTEMEEDFKAKQLVINLMGKSHQDGVIFPDSTCFPVRQKSAELRSVLDTQTKKRVGKSTLTTHLTKTINMTCNRDSHETRQEI